MQAAWGEVQKGGTQLAIRHYELGALFLPGLEQAYLNSRWRGFCANPPSTNPLPVPQLPPITKVKYVQWVRGTPQPGRVQNGGVMEVPLPVPYALPPHPYEREGAGKDVPWAVDGRWPGLDTWGRRSGEPRGMMYGLPDDVQWDAF
jgi:Tyrosyl-DNA phosphodiesterase